MPEAFPADKFESCPLPPSVTIRELVEPLTPLLRQNADKIEAVVARWEHGIGERSAARSAWCARRDEFLGKTKKGKTKKGAELPPESPAGFVRESIHAPSGEPEQRAVVIATGDMSGDGSKATVEQGVVRFQPHEPVEVDLPADLSFDAEPNADLPTWPDPRGERSAPLTDDECVVLVASAFDVKHAEAPIVSKLDRHYRALLAAAASIIDERLTGDDVRMARDIIERAVSVPHECEAALACKPGDAGGSEEQTQPKPRVKRDVAEPLIHDHLLRRPHYTVKEIADKVGCSVGLVSESPPWQANQVRLAIAKKLGVDPTTISLDEHWINDAGASADQQLCRHREHAAKIDEAIDSKDRELGKRIEEYRVGRPNATPSEIARALGCTAGDVERRDGLLKSLVAEQAADERAEEWPSRPEP